jgi:hypothetical protein
MRSDPTRTGRSRPSIAPPWARASDPIGEFAHPTSALPAKEFPVPLRPDALYHPLYLSPRRGLDVNPFEAAPKRRSETLATVRRPVRDRAFHVEHLRLELLIFPKSFNINWRKSKNA